MMKGSPVKNVIGIDPDSQAHGVAWFKNGVLNELTEMSLFHLLDYLEKIKCEHGDCLISIENVLINESIHKNKKQNTIKKHGSVGVDIGKCLQAQRELMRGLDWCNYKYVLYPPSSQWKSTSEVSLFKKITGWDKSGNADTRSAAYFGWLALTGNKIFEEII